MSDSLRFLVLGATGGTGRHFVNIALSNGHKVRALVRTPEKLGDTASKIEVVKGSITDPDINTDQLVGHVDVVVSMLGDKNLQAKEKINYNFFRRLVPSMRRQGCHKLLYQAGGFSKPYNEDLGWILWTMRNTIARGYLGQHRDNDAVIEYLNTDANDIDWIIHRAGINGDGPSKGTLKRATGGFPSIAPFVDCAQYTYDAIMDPTAVRTCALSQYK